MRNYVFFLVLLIILVFGLYFISQQIYKKYENMYENFTHSAMGSLKLRFTRTPKVIQQTKKTGEVDLIDIQKRDTNTIRYLETLIF